MASSLLDMLIALVSVDSSEELLKKLDKSGNGTIELNELPPEWPDLPIRRAGGDGQRIPEGTDEGVAGQIGGTWTVEDVLQDVRVAAKRLKDKFSRTAQSLEVLQAGLRAEAVTLNKFAIDSIQGAPDIEQVVQIGLAERHDLMNARARVMDRRRQVEIAANRLEAALDIAIDGNIGFPVKMQIRRNIVRP